MRNPSAQPRRPTSRGGFPTEGSRTAWLQYKAWSWGYPIASTLLASCALFGFMVLRCVQTRGALTTAWVLHELRGQPSTYAYLAGALFVSFICLGRVFRRTERVLLAASMTDPSTGLANRRPFQAALSHAVELAALRGTPVSLIMIDLDGLKAINDAHGHAVGDASLKLVAESVRATCRATDLAARWGGDEFVVLARGTSAEGAQEVGERIRSNLRRLQAQEKRATSEAITVSIGIADMKHSGAPRPEALFFAADRALYQAKAAGKDRVVMAAMTAESRFSHPTLLFDLATPREAPAGVDTVARAGRPAAANDAGKGSVPGKLDLAGRWA